MDDISNQYFAENKPLSPEEFDMVLSDIDAGKVQEEVSPFNGEYPEVKPEVEESMGVGETLVDMGRGVVTGVPKAGTEIIHTGANLADALADSPLSSFTPAGVILNADKKLQELISGNETGEGYFTKQADKYAPRLTEDMFNSVGLKVPKTTAGKLTESATQFFTTFIPALKGARVIGGGIKGTTALANTVKNAIGSGGAGAVADLTAFNPYEARLSNWAKDSGIPGLDNQITQYLAADEGDSELEGRLKQTLEGYLVGKAVGGVIDAVKAFKNLKGAVKKEQLKPVTKVASKAVTSEGAEVAKEATKQGVEVKPFKLSDEESFVHVLPDEAKDDLATKLLDGDIEGASKTASTTVNLKHIQTEDDVKDLIEALAVTREDAIGKQRRTWAEAAAKEGTDLETYTARVNSLDSDVVKAEYARTTIAYKVKELANILKANPSDITKAEFADAFAKLNVVDAMVQQNKAEVARALNIMKRSTSTNRISSEIKELAKQSTDGAGRTDWEKLAAMIGDMPDSVGITNMAKALRKPDWKDALTEVYVNNLFSPITLAKNLTATGISIANSVPERYLGAVKSLASGSGELTFREANQYALGLVKATREALRIGTKSWKTEVPQLSSTANEFVDHVKTGAFSGEAFGITPESGKLMQYLGKGLDYLGIGLRSMPGGTRSLMSTDEMMKTFVYRAEVGALAQRQAFKEGLEPGTEAFTKKLLEIDQAVAFKDPSSPYHGISLQAMDEAHRRTFTERLSENGESLLTAMRNYKSSYLVLPFVKTPVNLVKYMARRTPVLSGFSEYVESELKAGGARADLVAAQMSLGSAYTVAGATLAGAGLLQGDYSENWTVNRNLRALGIQPRSFVTPDGDQISLQGFDGSPVSMMLLSATAQETMEAYLEYNEDRMSDDELQAGIAEIMMIPATAFMKYGVNSTWGRGVSQLLNAAEDGNWNNYVNSQAGNFLPLANTVKYVNNQFEIDPFSREIDTAMDAIRAKLPHFSRQVAPKATLLGDPSKIPQYMAQGLVPSFVVTPPDHPVFSELNRLQRLDPNQVVLGGIPKEVDGVELDGVEQWNLMRFMKYLKVDGKDLLGTLQEVMESEDYQGLTDTSKENLLTKVYQKRKELAKTALKMDAISFFNGEDRPYSEEFSLYDYKRSNSITNDIAQEEAIELKDKFGKAFTEDTTKEQYINNYNKSLIENNFISELLD